MMTLNDDYMFKNCTCSLEQQAWQERAVKALLPIGEMLQNAGSRFNTRVDHVMTLDEEITVCILCDWLKYFNGFQLLVSCGKFDVSMGIVRTLLEQTIQLAYLLTDDKELKAAYYYVSFFIKGHAHNQKLFKNGIYTKKPLRIMRG